MNCGNCRNYFIDANMGNLTVCRRFPPQMTAFEKIYAPTVGGEEPQAGDQIRSYFNYPVVNADWSCGEFAAKGVA